MGGWHNFNLSHSTYLKRKELMPLTIFEAIMVAISLSTLIVSVLALSFTFTQKK